MFGDLVKRVWHFLIRMDIVAILILLVLLLVPLGSCFPQRPINLEMDSQRLKLWDSSIKARYGGLAELLDSIGLFRFFNSPMFNAALSVLILSTLICSLDRWRGVWRRAFRYEVVCAEATYRTADNRLKLHAGPDFHLEKISGSFTKHGYRIRMEKDDQTAHYRGDINRFSISATLFTHVGILLLISGALLSATLGWREEIIIGPGMIGVIPSADNTELHFEDFLIQRYPDGSASAFEARIQVKEQDEETYTASLKLNQPLIVNGMSVLLQGYSKVGEDTLVSLLVVRDPGYLLVILAGLLFLLGTVVTFYFPHSCIYARAEPDGVIYIAGRSDRRAYTFTRQFNELVHEFERLGLRKAEG